MAFSVGDRVRSKKVGIRAAFDGHVVEVRELTRFFPESYDVRDADGADWNRGTTELSLIPAVVAIVEAA